MHNVITLVTNSFFVLYSISDDYFSLATVRNLNKTRSGGDQYQSTAINSQPSRKQIANPRRKLKTNANTWHVLGSANENYAGRRKNKRTTGSRTLLSNITRYVCLDAIVFSYIPVENSCLSAVSQSVLRS